MYFFCIGSNYRRVFSFTSLPKSLNISRLHRHWRYLLIWHKRNSIFQCLHLALGVVQRTYSLPGESSHTNQAWPIKVIAKHHPEKANEPRRTFLLASPRRSTYLPEECQQVCQYSPGEGWGTLRMRKNHHASQIPSLWRTPRGRGGAAQGSPQDKLWLGTRPKLLGQYPRSSGSLRALGKDQE